MWPSATVQYCQANDTIRFSIKYKQSYCICCGRTHNGMRCMYINSMIDIINLAQVAFNVQRYNIQEVLNKINITQNKINNFVNSPLMIEYQFALLIISVYSIYVGKGIHVNTMNRISYDNNLYYNFYLYLFCMVCNVTKSN